KTGTLTRGRPTVSGVRALDCAHGVAHAAKDGGAPSACAPCDDLVALAASVERGSAHPFARAVVHAAEERRVVHRFGHASDITSHTGRGVSGTLNGRRVVVGNATLFSPSAAVDALVAENGDGTSLMLVGENGAVRGYIAVEDRPRPTTAAALRALKAIDPGYRVVMLTGDRRGVAEALGGELE